EEILEAGRDPDEVVVSETPKQRPVEGLDFEIAQHVLSALLKRASFSIPVRDWQPVLRNFMVMAIPGRLRLVASTGEFTTVIETTMVITHQPGLALLPSTQILEVVKAVSGGTLRVHANEERVRVSIDR